MQNNIVYIKNKYTGIYQNRTLDIDSCTYDANGYKIKFKGKDNIFNYLKGSNKIKVYNVIKDKSLSNQEIVIYNKKAYNPERIFYLFEPLIGEEKIMFLDSLNEIVADEFEISIVRPLNTIENIEDMIIRRKDLSILYNVNTIFVYSSWYKIIYENGKEKLYSKDSIIISEKINSVGNFSYYKDISKLLIESDDKKTEFLSNQYEKLSVDNQTILYNYLSTRKVISNLTTKSNIFPFNFNLSQLDAVKRAFSNNISIIEGPPGTGKTQTILNILANAIINEKTVAVVSGNNYAIDNIKKKLKEYDLDFLVALLGCEDNRNNFFKNSNEIPRLDEYKLDQQEIINLEEKLSINFVGIRTHLSLDNKLAEKIQEYTNLKNQYEYFEDMYSKSKVSDINFSRLNEGKLSDFIVDSYVIATKDKVGILKRFKLFFKYGFLQFKKLDNDIYSVILNLKKYLYIKKLNDLEKEIESIKVQLENINYKDKKAELVEESMKLFRAKIYNYYEKYSNEISETFSNEFNESSYYKKKFNKFIKKHPVILSTVHSLKSCSGKDFIYDYVIIDEASQTDIASSIIAMSCARNIIIVGDLKQISHIVPEKLAKQVEVLNQKYNISNGYDYIKYNILSSIKCLYPDVEDTLLREHYRCHPQIIGFCNMRFYNNKLSIHSKGDCNDVPFKLINMPKGNHTREDEDNKLLNLREIESILKYRSDINMENYDLKEIGFISPFNAQVNLAKEKLDKDIFKSTINKFQGQESNIIIFSTVIDKSTRSNQRRVEFVNNSNLINVAVSRAKKRFVLVTNTEAFKEGSNISELIRYIKYNTKAEDIINSKVVSIFDLMYKEYPDELLKIKLEEIKKVSNIPSENLANYVIEDVLKEEKYNFLDSTFSTSLKELIVDDSLLTKEEKRFVFDCDSEIDFIIFRKSDKKPVLIVEVDGFSYHSSKTAKRRDNTKNNILNKYGIKYTRWATNGSGERDDLIKNLDEIIG